VEVCPSKRPRRGAEDQQASAMSEVGHSSGESQLVSSTAEAGPSTSQSAHKTRVAALKCVKENHTKNKITPWSKDHLCLLKKEFKHFKKPPNSKTIKKLMMKEPGLQIRSIAQIKSRAWALINCKSGN